MKDSRKLSDYAQAKLDALRKEGIPLSDENICVINALAWEVQSPCKRLSLARGKPVKCGDFWLWPLTISGSLWYKEIGCKLQGIICKDLSVSECSIAYVMAHREIDAWKIEEKEVIEWGKHLTCTRSELREAMSQILEQDKRDEEPSSCDNGISIEELAVYMHATHGQDANMWEQEVSLGYVSDFIDMARAQASADGKKEQRNRAEACLSLYCHKLRKAARNAKEA